MNEQNYLVIDLEATCDNGGLVPKHEMETIEIGAVLVDGQTLSPIDEFQTFIRPVRHPQLTPFCQALTSIRQPMVSQAPSFEEAMEDLSSFLTEQDALFCSWGAYDKNQLRQDAAYHGVKLPLSSQHLNLKELFSRRLGTKRRFGMAGALRKLGLPLVGTHHRGIDDARNIARLLPFCVGGQPVMPDRLNRGRGSRRQPRRAP